MALFDESYFNGKNSNYIDGYLFRKEKYEGLAKDIKEILKLNKSNIVLDYGCAIGLIVFHLRNECLIDGTDISAWAIETGKKELELENNIFNYDKKLLSQFYEYVLLLDVLEHCEKEELYEIMTRIKLNMEIIKLVVRIPVSAKEGEDFVLPVSKNDKTHIRIHTKEWWREFFDYFEFEIEEKINKKYIYDSEGVLAWLLKRKN